MQKNRISAKRNIHSRSRQEQGNHSNHKNYFDIISCIPKKLEYEIPYEEPEDNYNFAENLITFLEYKFPEKIGKMFFTPGIDNIDNFIGQLVEAITGEGHIVTFRTYEEGMSKELTIYYRIPFKEYTWFVLSAAHIEKIPEPMKIGFAHLFMAFTSAMEEDKDFTSHDYVNTDRTMFTYNFPDFFEYHYDWNGKDDIEDEINKDLTFYKKRRDSILNYASGDLNRFFKFNPRDKKLQKIKSLIEYGLNLNFSIWHSFGDDEDYYEQCLLPYRDTVFALYDEELPLEVSYLQMYQENANEGHTLPCGFYCVKEGEVISKTTQDQIIEFVKVQEFICELSTNLYDLAKE